MVKIEQFMDSILELVYLVINILIVDLKLNFELLILSMYKDEMYVKKRKLKIKILEISLV